jgi:hypothetical protein
MGQVFGSRKLNTNEDSENMLGKLSIFGETKIYYIQWNKATYKLFQINN